MEYQTFSVRFECKSAKANKDGLAPVCIVVTVNKEYTVIQTRQRQKPQEFKKLLNSKQNNAVKTYCDNEKAKLQNIYSTLLSMPSITITSKLIKSCYVEGIEPTLSNQPLLLNITLRTLFNKFMEFKSEEKIQPSTFKKYKLAFESFLELTGHKDTEPASCIKYQDMMLFEAKCMNEKHYAEMTAKKKQKYVRSIFTFGYQSELLKRNPFAMLRIGRGEKESPTEYLVYSEIEKVRAADLRSDRLIKARDIFLFQCFTGLNISDVSVLKPEDIQQNDEGYYFIRKPRYKKGKFSKKYNYTSVMFEDAIKIAEDYKGVIPYESPQKLNVYLGEIMKIAGIDKHITSKCGRTTYACYLYNRLHLHIPIISKMMGHRSVKQTEEYLTIFQETVFESLEEKGKPDIEEDADKWDIEPDSESQELYKKIWGD